MRTIIDLTEDANFDDSRDELPWTVLRDDGEVVICMGETELRMTYMQFDRLLAAMNAWYGGPPEEERVVSEGGGDEHD